MAYTATPPKLNAEIEALDGRLTFDSELGLSDAHLWHMVMGDASPATFFEALAEGFRRTEICMQVKSEDRYTLHIDFMEEDFSQVAYSEMSYDEPSKTISRDGMTVEEEHRGNGISGIISRNGMHALRDAHPEATRMLITTEMEGAPQWARSGFVPFNTEWEAIRDELLVRAEKLDALLGIGDELKELIYGDPSNIAQIANKITKEDRFIDPATHEETTAGYFMLNSLEWTGRLDFSNAESMQAFNEFVEQKQTKTPHADAIAAQKNASKLTLSP
jgi:hypothetical protein